jgi:3-oxoacyl-(acyl-carrier-protein) synthase
MSIYINGIGAITPQGCFPSPDFLKEMKVSEPGCMHIVKPNYKEFIKPVPLRRMSKIIKMGLTSALMCLDDAQIKSPGAIITATGLGSVEDTDKFLDSLTDNQESILSPTPFIQSTHNAVAARIALETSCHDYNMTYVHKNVAFEHALLDSIMKLNSDNYRNILLGGTDEITKANYDLKKHLGFWKENVTNSELLGNNKSKGTIAGEGSVSFSLSSEKTTNSYAKVIGVKTFHKLSIAFKDTLAGFLASHNLTINDIDLVFMGVNANVDEDHVYGDASILFKDISQGWYKHLCGEYETSAAYAMLVAAQILKTNHIPDFVKLNNGPKETKNVLIYQQRFNQDHSFIILSKC